MAKRSAIEATENDLHAAEARGIESALADHREGHAKWPYDGALGLSGRQQAIQAAWVAAKRSKLIELGYER
jgi:hypothetical protein